MNSARACVALHRGLLVLLALFVLPSSPASALEPQELFDRFSDHVVQIRVLESGSEAKRSIGSGFVVDRSGHIVTNFHVVSDLVHHPERYKGELVDTDDETHPIELLSFDVVHDLALVRTERKFERRLQLFGNSLRKGDRVYSLGNPYDLGMSIVEGTYNGLLEHSRYERIHFTGSLNPGMSGGPALVGDGKVVGVNVATAGNQISFLIPVERVRALIDRAAESKYEPVGDYTEELRRQLLEYQDAYVKDLLKRPFETVKLGGFDAPTKLAPYFNCWGDTLHEDESPYRALAHQCFTEDRIFVSDAHDFSTVRLQHRQIDDEELGTARFYELYSWFFESNHSQLSGTEEDFSAFRCRTRFVDHTGRTFKTAFCVRRYKKLEGLYDAVFKAAALGEEDSGFETALILSGVSFDNAELLSRRYLEGIVWNP